MNKSLIELIRISFLFIALSWFFLSRNSSIYVLVSILVASYIIPIMIPEMKKTPTKKTTVKSKNNRTTSTKKSTSKKLKNPTDEQLLTADFNELEGVDFERLVAMYYEDKGYKVEIIGGSGDHGVDIVLTDPKDNYKIAVQCKRYKDTKIGNTPIAVIAGSKRFYGCHEAWVITNNFFTPKAEELAKKTKVKLFNGLYVQETIGKWRQDKLKKKQKLSMV